MKFFNHIATCILIAGIFGLSGCVVTERSYDHRGEPYAESRGDHNYDRHDDRDNRCDADHHGDGCQDEDHH